MSRKAIKARELYRKGLLSEQAVSAMLEAGKISQAEYDWIVGEDDAVPET